jgi:hypothetical protein
VARRAVTDVLGVLCALAARASIDRQQLESCECPRPRNARFRRPDSLVRNQPAISLTGVDLIAASRATDSAYTEWRRVNRTGLRHIQEARRPLYERTTAFKIYVSTVMPGLVQTPGYAKSLMSAITTFRETPDDVEDVGFTDE